MDPIRSRVKTAAIDLHGTDTTTDAIPCFEHFDAPDCSVSGLVLEQSCCAGKAGDTCADDDGVEVAGTGVEGCGHC